jgi:hypothetical protein
VAKEDGLPELALIAEIKNPNATFRTPVQLAADAARMGCFVLSLQTNVRSTFYSI